MGLIARVTPTYKSGSTSSLENYRPISFLPIVAKIAEKCVHTQLIHYLESNTFLSAKQFGFRQNRSTELAAVKFIDDIRLEVDRGNLVGAVFLDLSKAFDTISHAKLLSKLPSYEILGKEYNWLSDCLFFRKQSVSFKNAQSDPVAICSGVPQGSVLGPLLFLLLLNDIADSIKYAQIIKYADDTVLYVSSNCFEIIENNLSVDLELLAKWLDENDLVANLKKGKTESSLFGTPQRLSKVPGSLNLRFKHDNIHFTKTYTYLGLMVNNTLNSNSHFDTCYRKFSGRLRLFSKLRYLLDADSAHKIYTAMLIPLSSYCSLVSLKFTNGQCEKFTHLEKQASTIINSGSAIPLFIPSLLKMIKLRACIFVRKSLDGNVCDHYENYFKLNKHNINTRNNKHMLVLPRMRTEFGKKITLFYGCKDLQ